MIEQEAGLVVPADDFLSELGDNAGHTFGATGIA
jgi:hypothetical protein